MAHEAHRAPIRNGPLALAVVLALLAVGCGGAASSATTVPSVTTSTAPSAAAGGTVTAALSQFKVELGAATAPAGSVTFEVTNKGTVEHEFVVFKTDLAPDKLPLSADGKSVDEDGAGVTAIDEIAEFEPGTTQTLTVDLPAGTYVVICNVPTHYTSGMHAEFTTD